MPNKVNAPAVSQLAGEIENALNEFFDGEWEGTVSARDRQTLAGKLLQAFRLSEREEKVANVESAAKNLLAVLPKSAALVERVGGFIKELESALSALGESKW